jgi:LacI family transcriptional regulator
VPKEENLYHRPRKPTLKDVALKARVSTSTVSLVLRESPLVADNTRDLVKGWMERLGYVPNRGAANLRARTSQTIGLVICELTNPFYAELIAGIDSVLDERGRIAFIAHTGEDPERQDRMIRRLREQGVDGIILSPAEGTTAETIVKLREWDLPCVQALRHVGRGESDYIGPAIKKGVEASVDYLVAQGHRRIAYIGVARRTSVTRERLAGFAAGLRRHRLPPGPIVDCPPTRENGLRAVAALLATKEPPTAVIGYNDVCAFGAIQGFVEAGLTPKRDFGVVGFDNIADAALSRPALTTIGVDPHRIGREAANLLLDRIANPVDNFERRIMPTQLIVRDT